MLEHGFRNLRIPYLTAAALPSLFLSASCAANDDVLSVTTSDPRIVPVERVEIDFNVQNAPAHIRIFRDSGGRIVGHIEIEREETEIPSDVLNVKVCSVPMITSIALDDQSNGYITIFACRPGSFPGYQDGVIELIDGRVEFSWLEE